MISGLFRRAWREVSLPAGMLLTALVLVETLLAYALPSVAARLAPQINSLPFLKNIFRAVLGVDSGSGEGGTPLLAFSALPWAHPVVLALLWAIPVIACSRVPAGECERGTIDLLFSLPVSRWKIWLAESAVVLLIVLIAVTGMLAGHAFGAGLLSGKPGVVTAPMNSLPIIAVNLLALSLAVQGVSSLASAMSSRKGRAMMLVFLFLLGSFLVNYLAQVWPPASRVANLSILSYYRPFESMANGTSWTSRGSWPTTDIAVLMGIGVAAWSAGMMVFVKRDLCAS